MSYQQARYELKLIMEMSGESDFSLPPIESPTDAGEIPENLRRTELNIPNLSEREVVKHYTNLSQMNYGVDNGFYPLGSCTMKYNPKYADVLAALPTVADVHPYEDEEGVQGCLRLMYELERALAAISGMDAISLQPAAGAHGEFTGMLMARAYYDSIGEDRTEVIIPDAAHGTNPASAAMAGFDVIEIPSSPDGCVDLGALEAAVSDRTAALMLTNPNTLGIFEENILKVAEIVHGAGGLLYYDGANLNAIMGRTSPGIMDFDIVHFNLHKTFATPHGGGGPGAGPVGVKKFLEPFLPSPRIMLEDGIYRLLNDRPLSIGKVRSFYGNFAVLVRAYAYILRCGSDGLKAATDGAVLNANYLRKRLTPVYDMPFKELRKHEFVISAKRLKDEKGIRALDISKRLLDYGVMAPTIYFPSLVDEALMIEPTETESKETLDRFADVMLRVAAEDPQLVKDAPVNTSVRRVNEVRAAKELVLSYLGLRRRLTKDLASMRKDGRAKACSWCDTLLDTGNR
ncbi:MAG: aminomethyl-transferring glycine dehydrogenase subunit GcvPB [Euryarchaeota archaeon]|nr:aminomethyl-transferring glycine dehydrogenase subunit GcvPB [Euryarchaeota archaeon]